MSDPLECRAKVRELAVALDKLSRELGRVNRELRPIQEAYDTFIRDYEVGLYEACKGDESSKLPGKDMRLALALKEMPKDFRGKHHELIGQRDSLKQQISNLKVEVDAWRSVLSADKAELQALA